MAVFEELMGAAGLDDDGWAAAMSTVHGLDVHVVSAVLAGSGRTAALPATVVDKVLCRLVTQRGIDTVRAVTAGDQRAKVVSCVARLAEAVEVAARASEVDSILDELVAATVNRDDRFDIAYAPLGRLAVAVLSDSRAVAQAAFTGVAGGVFPGTDSTWDSERFVDATTHLVGQLDETTVRALIDVAVDAYDDSRDRAAAVALLFAVVRSAAKLGVAVDEEPAALAGVEAPAAMFADMLALSQRHWARSSAQKVLAYWAARCGVPVIGVGSIASALGYSTPYLGDGAGDLLVEAAVSAGDRAVVDDVLAALTEDGTRLRLLVRSMVEWSSPALPMSVAFAASGSTVTTARDLRVFVDACAGRFGHQWDAADATDAFDRFPDLASVALGLLPALSTEPASARPAWPDWLVVESQRRSGLAAWVRHDLKVRDELTAAAAGIGVARWSTLLSLLASFRGTVAELVAITDELAPAA